ncbi:glutamyl-tRNA reductase [Rhabdothermincola sediminis]|uniref:glutamyl-tRNA reductase n=1 Tax=Rhabdothermincola sediminis TaxID=2751370 RepID=UPI001AA05142|nr:glutamyl-tRNA reductase [Rhabdothermincola sediminis]
MSLVVIGLNHRTVPLDLLERMTIDESRLPKALHDVASREFVSEAVVLSTCNRTEIYVLAERFHPAYHDIRNFLSEVAYLPPEEFSDHLYVHYDDDAVHHLFAVAAGIDSAVVGEAEILGQVRAAWERARDEGTSGAALNMLFRHALEVGKRARSETGISRSIVSVSTAAVAMAADRLGSLEGRRVLVLGAGDMGEGMVRALVQRGVGDLFVANRTWERALELATRVGGTAVRLAELNETLATVDLLLTGTGASSIMLEHGDLARVMRARPGRPLLVVDVAVPRDVDPGAAELAGVTLLDMDDLRAFASAGMAERRREVTAVERIIAEELERFTALSTAREVAPLIAALHDKAEAVRTAELERFSARLSALDPVAREVVEALTRGLVAKLLHEPTVGLKGAAGTPRGERLAEAVRDLFDL